MQLNLLLKAIFDSLELFVNDSRLGIAIYRNYSIEAKIVLEWAIPPATEI